MLFRSGITDVDEVIQNIEKAFLLPGGVYNFGAPNNQDTFYTMNTIFQMAGLNESKIQKNEQAFFENPRNISMSQDKVNQNGIYFTSTQEGIRKKLVANDYKL